MSTIQIRHVLALAACVAEGIVYAFVGALLDWQGGGGVIPMMILFAAWGLTWTAIAKPRKQYGVMEDDEDEQG